MSAPTSPPAATEEAAARWQRVQVLFHEVVELPPAARAPLLDARCAGDAQLRAEVEELVAQDERTGGLLRGATGEMLGALAREVLHDASPALEGRRLGPYLLRRLIGHGGMGAVYLAEREDVGLHCALKVVRGGLAAPENVRRFLLERRLLARLRHPNIAAMLDAGVAEDGTPWLAMELVEGEPIDRYCDQHRLGVAQRLALFEQVCEAVAYAHRSLIVHRDIKPGNVLVTAEGVPKLLDFGIAKLLDDDEEAMTGTGLRLLTPEYAAPEQLAAEPVTTATDVYALGLVLFELLCGQRAIALATRTPAEIHRKVMSTTVPRPSTVVGRGAGEAIPGTDVATLRRQLAGDLDAIVLRALAREPERRYASVGTLLGDLQRHREGKPVIARPDTLGYRALSFVRRHRLRVAAATLAVAGLVAFAVTMAVQQRRTAAALARAETEQAKAQQVSTFLADMFDVADPFSGRAVRADSVTLRDFLMARGERVRALSGQPEVQLQAMNLVGKMYMSLGAYDRARPMFEEAIGIATRLGPGADRARVSAWVGIGDLERARTRFPASERAYRAALAIARRPGEEHREALALTLNGLGDMLRQAGRLDDAEPPLREALAIRRQLYGARNSRTADVMNNLGLLLWAKKDLAGAEPLLAEALAVHRALLPPVHPMTAAVLNNLGLVRRAKGDLPGAEAPLREALAIKRQLFGEGHWRLANGEINLASLLVQRGQLDEADALARNAAASLAREFPRGHELTGVALGHLGEIARRRGDLRTAERRLRASLAAFEGVLPARHQRIAGAALALGRFLAERGRDAEARPLLERAVAIHRGRNALDGQEGQEALKLLLHVAGDRVKPAADRVRAADGRR